MLINKWCTICPIFEQIFMVKTNSFTGSKIWYSVTIHIDSVQNRQNSSWQTKYGCYPIFIHKMRWHDDALINIELNYKGILKSKWDNEN